MHKFVTALLSLLAVAFLPSAFADTDYVSLNGSDSNPGNQAQPWRTIQKAANAAASGDTVLVQPGIYDELVTITNRGQTFRANGAVTNLGTFYVKNQTTIDDFDMTMRSAKFFGGGVYFYRGGVTNALIINNRFHDSPYLYSAGAGGIKFDNSNGSNWTQGIVISNNMFYNIPGVACTLNGIGHRIVNNTFSNSWGSDALHVYGRDTVIRGNRATAIGHNFTKVEGAGNPQFNGVYYWNVAESLSLFGGSPTWSNTAGYFLIKDPSFATNMRGLSNVVSIVNASKTAFASASSFQQPWTMHNAAIISPPTNAIGSIEHPDFILCAGPSLTYPTISGIMASNILVENNIVTDGIIGASIDLSWAYTNGVCSNWTIQNNVFARIDVQASINFPGIKFYNNTFYQCGNNYNGINVIAYGWFSVASNSWNGEAYRGDIKNNAFVCCGRGKSTAGWYTQTAGPQGYLPNPSMDLLTNADYNYVSSEGFLPKALGTTYPAALYRFYEPNGINGGDPGCVSLVADDFRLLSSSPLRGKGVFISGVTHDINGVRRLGRPYDIGAYAYVETGQSSQPPKPPRLAYVGPPR